MPRIPVAFDLRDPDRSGIARVARCNARAFLQQARGEFDVTLCGPREMLAHLGAPTWGDSSLVDWTAGRFSLKAQVTWNRVRRQTGDAIWYFPLWDVPWGDVPARSIVTIHDLTTIRVPGATTRSRRAVVKAWIRHVSRRATRIVAGTEFSRREVVEAWPDLANRVAVIPHGVEPRFFGEPEPLPMDVAAMLPDAEYVLSVGNRKPHKNLQIAVEVLRRLPDLHWVVVGERFRGWEHVTSLIERYRVGDRVHVLGQQPDAVLHRLYRDAACLLFPSRHEGFGLPVLEALASGTRVVAGTAGATVEVLGGHGAVCDCDDPDSFASAVSDARAAKRDGPFPADARAHAATFTWERSARAIAELVRDIAAD
ncbi:MAG TPA: glycosyltransferase family 1 protein [Gemmatimonadaceae bacterium]|nr:glycosyltransferase family 1 protein [Gemmatimonadaceae bacterium]